MDALDAVLGTYPSWSHLVVRLGLGVVFLAHGGQKVLGWFGGHGLGATIKAFKGMGVPAPAAATAAFVEFLGGLAMLVGFLARPAARGRNVVMLVANAKVHRRPRVFGNIYGTPGQGPGDEFNFVLIAMALSIFIGGAGVLSIDRALWLALGRGD